MLAELETMTSVSSFFWGRVIWNDASCCDEAIRSRAENREKGKAVYAFGKTYYHLFRSIKEGGNRKSQIK